MPDMPDRPIESTRVRVSTGVRASVSADGLVLLDLNADLVLSANAVGARIWELLETRLDTAAIARRLADDYRMPLDRVQRDVAAFVRDLESRGLVTSDPA